MLDAPFVQIIGLCSNLAEGPGDLEGADSDRQQIICLSSTLKTIAASRKAGERRAPIIGVHHPPFSKSGHSDSPTMLQEIDAAGKSGQHRPRRVARGRFPHIPALPARREHRRKALPGCGLWCHNDQAGTVGDHTFVKSTRGYGYLDIVVDAQYLQIDFNLVLGPAGVPGPGKKSFDSGRVNRATGKLA
jgi:hypothetical protein